MSDNESQKYMKEIYTRHSHEIFMKRCLELAIRGLGSVAPNPMVGAVLVHKGNIIGEGYHQEYGKSHAEVNAINSVRDQSLLKESTLYVNLEPCAHMGKTPPCADLIVRKGIPNVIIGTSDPNPLVAGRGIEHLKKNGVNVEQDILTEDCLELNKRFFSFHQKNRPYIILKWAQTSDGFIDTIRKPGEPIGVNWISNSLSQMLVHKWRAEEQAILIGTNTVLTDNPQLTVRLWEGRNPIRIIIDWNLRIPDTVAVFDQVTSTYVFNHRKKGKDSNTEWVQVEMKDKGMEPVLGWLYNREILSLIVEGGKEMLEYFIANRFWNEARIFIGNKTFGKGVKAPDIFGEKIVDETLLTDRLLVIRQ
jgi:diaminohydroxyphosphoribosylaminopyrimidine deaminase / 5-amino-6-(5-phosphoribosylamino)uracil reductase